MLAIVHLLGTYLANLFKSRRRLEAENLFLRHQLNIALRQGPPPLRLRGSDRALLVASGRVQDLLVLEIPRPGRKTQDRARAMRSHPTNEHGEPVVGSPAHPW